MSGAILSQYAFVGLTLSVLYLLFCWFHACILMNTPPMDFNTGSYCPKCQSITGMGLRHCNDCGKCIPEKWVHCHTMNRCCDRDLRRRCLSLFKIIVVTIGILNIVYCLENRYAALLLPVHAYILKSTYVNTKRGINIKE